MDSAIPAFSADVMRPVTPRFNLSSSARTAHSLQSGLFEQLLTPTPRIERESWSPTTSGPSSSADSMAPHDRHSNPSNATHRSEHAERPVDESDDNLDDDEQSIAIAPQDPVLPAISGVAPLPAEGETAARIAGDGQAEDSAPGEMSAESSDAKTEDVTRPTQDALEDGTLAADSLDRSARSQLGASQSPAGKLDSVGAKSNVAESQTASPHGAQMSISDSANTKTAIGEQATSTTVAELGSRELHHAQEHIATGGETNQGSGQAESAPSEEGQVREKRREKWFKPDKDHIRGAERESNLVSKEPVGHADAASDKNSTDGALHSGATDATTRVANAQQTPVAESVAAHGLPDSLVPPQAVVNSASIVAVDRSLAAVENAGSGAQGGERHSTQGNVFERVEISSQHQSGSQRAAATTEAQDAQRPDALTQAERVRLVQRVSRSFTRLGPMGGQISLKLHPAQLGALNVQVRMEGRSMTAKLTTENSAARDAILESLPVLRTRLAEQGFEIGSFQVEVADSRSDATSGNDTARPGYDQTGGGEQRQAGQETDYRRLAAQQREPTDRYDAFPNSVASGVAAWELPRGVDVEA